MRMLLSIFFKISSRILPFSGGFYCPSRVGQTKKADSSNYQQQNFSLLILNELLSSHNLDMNHRFLIDGNEY